jgi:hypothetical protein
MPNVKVSMLTILCVITFINIFSGGLITPLYNIFTITNHVKGNAILNILTGIVSTIIVIIVLNTTNLGVYAIVGVSAFLGIFKSFVIVPCYSAKCLNIKYTSFFPTIFKYFLSSVFMIGAFYLVSLVLNITNWLGLFISVGICGVIGLLINVVVMLGKEDRHIFINILKNKLGLNK